MFDIAPSELLLVAFVALVVIGPKDLPKAMRVVGYWVGRARAVGRQFRSGFDEMVREAELEEMEKKWKAENERIMRENPFAPPPPHSPPAPMLDAPADAGTVPHEAPGDDPADRPVMVERPAVAAPDAAAPASMHDADGQHAGRHDAGRHDVDKASS
jgi:sec-independent protein translocase protein TatB